MAANHKNLHLSNINIKPKLLYLHSIYSFLYFRLNYDKMNYFCNNAVAVN